MAIRTGRLRFGPDNGRMLLRTGRKGVGSTVGHDLTIEVTDWSVELNVPETEPADATATARVELGSLAVREGTGGAVPLTDKDRSEIENNARRTLDVDRHPTATFESTRVVTGDESATISGTLTLHGVAAPIDVQVRELTPDRYRATTVVTQSAYGIKPYSAFLGALKVRDDVEVEIEVRLGG
ncbi:YceI family protein [Micromonospora globispora]|uniref:YceI family protein n=1 Tax=Micromonospora globispora TaxID=1450148 RepID=UPI000D6FD03E|nr:YceI family protein [Micromonospora globispora]PWU59531.1 YceI family protein [Micromonospora globispora]